MHTFDAGLKGEQLRREILTNCGQVRTIYTPEKMLYIT